MAIPFFEPRQAAVDQVDGHGLPPTAPAPAASISIPGTTNEHATTANQTNNQSTNNADGPEQVLAWKVLAVAVCKALKEYYQQTASSKDAFTSAVVQVLPNGQVQPLWK